MSKLVNRRLSLVVDKLVINTVRDGELTRGVLRVQRNREILYKL